MLDHINDSTDQAHELAKLMKDTPWQKVNLIPFNPYPGSPLRPFISNSRIDRFSKVLMGVWFYSDRA